MVTAGIKSKSEAAKGGQIQEETERGRGAGQGCPLAPWGDGETGCAFDSPPTWCRHPPRHLADSRVSDLGRFVAEDILLRAD